MAVEAYQVDAVNAGCGVLAVAGRDGLGRVYTVDQDICIAYVHVWLLRPVS